MQLARLHSSFEVPLPAGLIFNSCRAARRSASSNPRMGSTSISPRKSGGGPSFWPPVDLILASFSTSTLSSLRQVRITRWFMVNGSDLAIRLVLKCLFRRMAAWLAGRYDGLGGSSCSRFRVEIWWQHFAKYLLSVPRDRVHGHPHS